jgi:hypothetical protein
VGPPKRGEVLVALIISHLTHLQSSQDQRIAKYSLMHLMRCEILPVSRRALRSLRRFSLHGFSLLWLLLLCSRREVKNLG